MGWVRERVDSGWIRGEGGGFGSKSRSKLSFNEAGRQAPRLALRGKGGGVTSWLELAIAAAVFEALLDGN